MSHDFAQANYKVFSSKKEDQGIETLGNDVTVYLVNDIFNTEALLRTAGSCQKETAAFVQYSKNQWLIRWFSGRAEIKRCGIGTLAAAKYIQDYQSNNKDNNCSRLRFHSVFNQVISNEMIGAVIERNSLSGSLFMQAQSLVPIDIPNVFSHEYKHVISSVWLARDGYIVIELFQPQHVKSFHLGTSIKNWLERRALIITSTASNCHHSDIVFRYFAPAFGFDEDKATGSAAVILAPYWKKRLNKSIIKAHQISNKEAFFTYKVDDEKIEIIARVEKLA